MEEVLYQFPGVKEVSVIGVPAARKGEQPLAFIAAAEGIVLEERALLQFARGKMADYKVPRRVVFLDALPRNATPARFSRLRFGKWPDGEPLGRRGGVGCRDD